MDPYRHYFRTVREDVDAESRRQFRAAVTVACLLLGAGIVGWCIILAAVQ